MHKFNILIFGPKNFTSALEELRPYLKFSFFSIQKITNDTLSKNFDGFICHQDVSEDKEFNKLVESSNCFKILATNKNTSKTKFFDHSLKLPASLKDFNDIIENSAAKKQFNKNSSIRIKSYFLDKNQKKLIKENSFIILTEKEIQLLELFLSQNKPISKNSILSTVWKYSSDADTHTVETHIYRLRKKINEKFSDEKFIVNFKEGYSI